MVDVDVFSDDSIDEALEHYGVRGMKWGVRRSRSELASSRRKTPEDKETKRLNKVVKGTNATRYTREDGKGEPVTVFSSPKRGVVAKTGGTNHDASEDAKLAQAFIRVQQTNSIASLSNKQLETVTKRLNLEMGYQQAMAKRYPPKENVFLKIGKKFIQDEIKAVAGGKPPKSAPVIAAIRSNGYTGSHRTPAYKGKRGKK